MLHIPVKRLIILTLSFAIGGCASSTFTVVPYQEGLTAEEFRSPYVPNKEAHPPKGNYIADGSKSHAWNVLIASGMSTARGPIIDAGAKLDGKLLSGTEGGKTTADTIAEATFGYSHLSKTGSLGNVSGADAIGALYIASAFLGHKTHISRSPHIIAWVPMDDAANKLSVNKQIREDYLTAMSAILPPHLSIVMRKTEGMTLVGDEPWVRNEWFVEGGRCGKVIDNDGCEVEPMPQVNLISDNTRAPDWLGGGKAALVRQYLNSTFDTYNDSIFLKAVGLTKDDFLLKLSQHLPEYFYIYKPLKTSWTNQTEPRVYSQGKILSFKVNN